MNCPFYMNCPYSHSRDGKYNKKRQQICINLRIFYKCGPYKINPEFRIRKVWIWILLDSGFSKNLDLIVTLWIQLPILSDLPVVNVICPLLNQREQILIPDNFIRSRRIKLLQLFDAFIAMERRLIMQYNSRFGCNSISICSYSYWQSKLFNKLLFI